VIPTLHQLEIEGALLTRGFWLYIWEISVRDGHTLHYVGKTGDKPSGRSQSPFDRVSKHLGDNPNNNALRRHLRTKEVDPENSRFRFHAYGPLFSNELTAEHGVLCDNMSGLEKALASALRNAGYEVVNEVHSRHSADPDQFERIRSSFAAKFPKLRLKKANTGENKRRK
jgi:hypothetical protein